MHHPPCSKLQKSCLCLQTDPDTTASTLTPLQSHSKCACACPCSTHQFMAQRLSDVFLLAAVRCAEVQHTHTHTHTHLKHPPCVQTPAAQSMCCLLSTDVCLAQQIYSGGSVDGATQLTAGTSDICLNWSGAEVHSSQAHPLFCSAWQPSDVFTHMHIFRSVLCRNRWFG